MTRREKVERRRFLRVRDVRDELQCSKGFVFSLIKRGRIRASKLDGLLLIEGASFEEYLADRQPVRRDVAS